MNKTILNNASVFAINSNEIFNFSPKRKIEILNVNNNLSPLDKNFTYLITIHPISPYSQDTTNHNYLQANDIKCPPNTLLDTEDYHYLNKDAFEQWNDTTNSFFPILSYDSTCNYDNTSFENGDLYNCFILFIYKKKLHQVINDSTSSPALVHCKIELDEIQNQYNKYYHIILTRNDDIYTMHLILDEFSIFSSYDPKNIYRLPDTRSNTSAFPIKDATSLNITEYGQEFDINIDSEYCIKLNYDNNNFYAIFTIPTQQTISIETYSDECNKLDGCTAVSHYSSLFNITYGGIAPANTGFDYIYNPDYIIDQGNNNIQKTTEKGRFSIFRNLPAGTYKIPFTISKNYFNYSKIAFKSFTDYNTNLDYNEVSNCPKNISFKVYQNENFDKSYFDFNYNYKTNTIIQNQNINISELINDSTITLGYIERFPLNVLENNLLYKNSFKGYISEFSVYINQCYLRKFNNINDFNSFQQITDYTASENLSLPQNSNIKPNFPGIIDNENISNPFSSSTIKQNLIINENKIPLKSYFNLSENNSYFSTQRTYIPSQASESSYDIPMPRLEYLTNFKIEDIILINEKVLNVELLDNYSNKITHIEYPRNIDENKNINYTGNSITIENKTFCIFTFDILKNILSTSGYEVYDQKRFLMRNDYTLEEYDEQTSYSNYLILDSTNNYIQPINFTSNKTNILLALNNYINTIKESPDNLYIIKFVIQCFRDSRYMFLYQISNKTLKTDRFNYYNYQLDCLAFETDSIYSNNNVFDNITSPYYIYSDNLLNRYDDTQYLNRKPANLNGFNGDQFIYNSIYYSTEKTNNSNTIYSLYSNEMFNEDFYPVPLEVLYNIITPTRNYNNMYQSDIELDRLNYDFIRIVDTNNNIYIIMEIDDYIYNYGNTISKYFESDIITDGTIINEIIQTPNKHYYIELYNSINNSKVIAGDFFINQGSIHNFSLDYTISEYDSTSYKIDYSNVDSTNMVLFIYLDFINRENEDSKYKQALQIFEHTHEYSNDNTQCHVLPITKSKKKSDIQIEYEKLFSKDQSIFQQYPINEYYIYSNPSVNYSSQLYNIITYKNYEMGVKSSGAFSSAFNEYRFYNFSEQGDYFLFTPINLTYENNKRIITDMENGI